MESSPTEESEGKAIVKVLAVVLERLVSANSELAAQQEADNSQLTKFHALRAPAIGILQYLERIHKYASCSKECFVLALIYIDRLIQGNNFLLTELNAHRVVITAILLAAKFFDDAYYNNAYYAKVGGVLTSEMNSLEVDFLFRINFSLRVEPYVFQKYYAELSSHTNEMGLISIKSCTDDDLLTQNRMEDPRPRVHSAPCNHVQDYVPPQVSGMPQPGVATSQLDFSEMFDNAKSAYEAVTSNQQPHGTQDRHSFSTALDSSYTVQPLHQSQSQPSFYKGSSQPRNTADLPFPTLPNLVGSQLQQSANSAESNGNHTFTPQAQLQHVIDPSQKLLQTALASNGQLGLDNQMTHPLLATQQQHVTPHQDSYPIQAAKSDHVNFMAQAGLQHHFQHQQPPEITPSPPPQNTVIHATLTPFPNVNLSGMSALPAHGIHGSCSSQYANPIDHAIAMHQQQSQPIAIGTAATSADNLGGAWSYVSSFERRTGGGV
mmetsp:Transcript_37805/g.90440  ORF Transcript_37805/g.90440 Transcript_37805/m.90440 type:complete len:491 (+) Transcript_37805:400-1872(+)